MSPSAAPELARHALSIGLALLSCPVCESLAAAVLPGEESVVWVRFTDRGPLEAASPSERESAARAQLSARSWERRARRTGDDRPLAGDLPVHDGYVQVLAAQGARVRTVSRWLNAASVAADDATLARVARLPFVERLEPVARRESPRWEEFEREILGPSELEESGATAAGAERTNVQQMPGDPSFYGASHAQNRVIEADDLHALGLTGNGVLVALLDTGFRETHRVFDPLDVLARRDFLNGDGIVSNEPGEDPTSPNQQGHGTMVLSTIGGYLPGVHIGVAYGAQFALAKTERLTSETAVEMDYWQMAAEWADSLGADVISSSLGYTTFDNPADSYVYADLDGRTTTVSLAAVEAARRGITVVTAQGNLGAMPWHYLIAPADADNACAVGAVDSLGQIASFSSYGPSSDGRVKPDVCAVGVRIRAASATNDSAFVRPNGTSFATPAAAGLAALLLEAHPEWGPFEVLESLRSTASRATTPDVRYGFGIARGAGALAWVPSTVGAPAAHSVSAPLLEPLGPTPQRGVLRFRLLAGEGGAARLRLYDVRGREVGTLFDAPLGPGEVRLVSTPSSLALASGVYLAVFSTSDGESVRRVVFIR